MSLLDNLTDTLKSMFSQSGNTSDQSVLGAVLEKSGGMQGILDKLHAGGYSEVVSSWMSSGSNLPISTDQIKSALGNEHVQQIASQLGVSPDKALAALSEHLPGLCSKQTMH
ncbi:MAG TPA: YidB family protein [Rhizomicrobium sp.]|nr:YidB family protein [Rhizomicrobium sp.]